MTTILKTFEGTVKQGHISIMDYLVTDIDDVDDDDDNE